MRTITLNKSDLTENAKKSGVWNEILDGIGLKEIDDYQSEDSYVEIMIQSGTANN